MHFRTTTLRAIAALALGLAATFGVRADEAPVPATQNPASFVDRIADHASASVFAVQNTLETALDLIGIRYHRGGTSPETGFDCSGFVSHVFKQGLGLYLPHNAKQISKEGEVVAKGELQPGDLVFFNTMQRDFSHVGIYVGDGKFIHSPKPGAQVRVEDMHAAYWSRRFDGARRVMTDEPVTD